MPQLIAGITAAIGAVGAAAGTAFAAGGFFTTITGRLLLSVALSALSSALVEKPPTPGIRTESTMIGGDNPLSFILGRYATAGVHLCPPMSHGMVDKTPNAYMTYVIGISCLPGVTLNRVIIDGEYAALGGSPHATYGTPILGPFTDHAWVKWKDNATAVDSYLSSKYGSYPQRPWASDMIGRGLTYAIVTVRFNTEIFKSKPDIRFEVDGTPLYDPRKDSTNGGSGSHRWGTRSTWEQTNNPMVMAYSIARGLTLEDGSRWGGEARLKEMPNASWVAAMNVCDEAVNLSGGGTEPRYRAGMEVSLADEPFSILGQLIKSCAGAMAEVGGSYKVRSGGPGSPVYYFTDDDVIASQGQEYTPFPGLGDIFNGVEASYPAPGSLWEVKKAPPRYNATYQTSDDNRQLVAQLDLPSVPYGNQVRRLMKALIQEERRFARHVVTLPPSAMVLEPLDVVSWDSARNGYTDKRFEVVEVGLDPTSLLVSVTLRERNPADYDWTSAEELAEDSPGSGIVRPAAQAVPSFAATAVNLTDDSGYARRPAIRLTWDGADQDGVRGLEYELRRFGTTDVIGRGSVTDVAAGLWTLPDTLIPATSYEVRARFVTKRARSWTSWAGVTTLAVYFDDRDTAIPDIDGNLIRNGRFKYGDFRFWSAVPGSWGIVPRNTGSGEARIADAPTRNILRIVATIANQTAQIDTFDVDPNDRYRMAFRLAVLDPDAKKVDIAVVIEYFTGTDVSLGSTTINANTDGTPWITRTDNLAAAPVNADYAKVSLTVGGADLGFAQPTVYMTGFKVFSRRDAQDRNDDSTITTLLMKPQATRRRIADYNAALTVTTGTQTLTTVTHTDADAADEPGDISFTCQLRYDPPSGDTPVQVSFELDGPGAYSRTYQITVRNFGGGTASLFYPITLIGVCPSSGSQPETFRVRVSRNVGSGTVEVLRAQMRAIKFKR